jgi:hypothetical protein
MTTERQYRKTVDKTIRQTVENILALGDNPNSVHDAPVMDRNQNDAIRLLAEQLDTLWTIVKAYKTGKL